ncbi:MAG: hypothetical protein COB30_002235 [Ectothiorhodospiraceae bacterium]|nr:hypothetical protein [Ectothiorhodospiraceae bacterium]
MRSIVVFMRSIAVLMMLVLASSVQGGELWNDIKISTKKASSAVQENLSKKEDRDLREDKNIALNLNISPANFPFPLAWGVNANYIINGNWMIGVDYLRSNKALGLFSVEFGEIQERTYAIQARRFFGNSFNVKFGIGKRSTEIRFARDLFDLVTTNYSETASEFESKFIRFGFGNQWHFKRKYTVAVDWFSLDIPYDGKVITSASRFADSQEDKDDIEDVESILKYYPNAAVVKFEVGVIF